MKAFTEPLKKLGEFSEIKAALKRTGVVQTAGCIDAQKPHFIFGAGEEFPCKVILTYSETRAKELYENYRFFDREALLYPARDLIFYSADIHSNLIVQQRIAALRAVLEREQVTIITTMGGCMDHLVPPEELKKISCVFETTVWWRLRPCGCALQLWDMKRCPRWRARDSSLSGAESSIFFL